MYEEGLKSDTDLGSLIRNTQCGNFRIFLLLRFYVKSILIILKSQKLPFMPFEQPWILNFRNFWHFQVWIFSKNQNSKPSKLLKQQFFDLLKSAKIDFMQKQNGRKIAKFPHCAIAGSIFFLVSIKQRCLPTYYLMKFGWKYFSIYQPISYITQLQ